MKFFGKEQQDQFAYHLIGDKGVFLDIGCHHPIQWNNTQTLELIGWTGLMIDIRQKWVNMCNLYRKMPAFCVDATTDEFIKTLKNNTDIKAFDYISLDCDEAGVLALTNLINNEFSFKCMTFEHDSYAYGEDLGATPSRKILHDAGYIMLFKDVLTDGTDKEYLEPWEDWWIDPKYFSNDILKIKSEKIYYGDCIKKIKEHKIEAAK